MVKNQQDDNDNQQVAQPKASGPVSGQQKEQAPLSQVDSGAEKVADGLVEQWSDEVEMEPEVEEHVERVVRGEVDLPDGLPVIDEEGKKVLESVQSEETKIVLPVDELTAQQGKKSPVSNALSWLLEFCKRTILKYPGKVIWPQK